MELNEGNDEKKRSATGSVVQKVCMISGFLLDFVDEYEGWRLRRLSGEGLS